MDRREFIAGLAVTLASTPLAAEAQPVEKSARVGMLRSAAEPPDFGNMVANLRVFRDGLREHGYVEGRNLVIEFRYPRGENDTLSGLAADLVRLRVDVIHAAGPPAVRAATGATATIPIVAHDFETDPVEAGLVASVACPGGNVTGMFLDLPELAGKYLDLLRTAVPRLSRVAVLWDPGTGEAQVRAAKVSARALTLALTVVEVRGPADFEPAFRSAVKQRAQALVVLSSPLFGPSHRVGTGVTASSRIAELAIRHRLPSVTLFPSFARAGGLMAYGPSNLDLYRQEARLVAKVLGGASAADLPVERPTRFELIVNLKTARALGLTIPPSLLRRADEVIH